jgi:NAD-dependent SIR2 family protein deacetylase
MTTYNVFCDSCAAEYSVTPLAGSDTRPTHCAYCGSEIAEETILERNEDWPAEDWEKLIEDDEWSSEDDR